MPAPRSEGERSPNGAYRVWTRNPSIRDAPPRTATVIVDVERDQTLWIELRDVASPVVPTWVNEKLLFVRAWWGRLIGIDVLIDVEAGTLAYAEEIDAGTIAFEQYREACAGQCPCLPASAQATTDDAPPLSKAAPDEPAADLAALAKSLVYLDADWDGRVWSEASGRTWVASAVHGAGVAGERGEYPAEILEVRETPAGPWLRVDLFEVSTCQDPNAKVVHRGWIPAFSSAGRLVAGRYPGGC
jgi:hypothetical protein